MSRTWIQLRETIIQHWCQDSGRSWSHLLPININKLIMLTTVILLSCMSTLDNLLLLSTSGLYHYLGLGSWRRLEDWLEPVLDSVSYLWSRSSTGSSSGSADCPSRRRGWKSWRGNSQWWAMELTTMQNKMGVLIRFGMRDGINQISRRKMTGMWDCVRWNIKKMQILTMAMVASSQEPAQCAPSKSDISWLSWECFSENIQTIQMF